MKKIIIVLSILVILLSSMLVYEFYDKKPQQRQIVADINPDKAKFIEFYSKVSEKSDAIDKDYREAFSMFKSIESVEKNRIAYGVALQRSLDASQHLTELLDLKTPDFVDSTMKSEVDEAKRKLVFAFARKVDLLDQYRKSRIDPASAPADAILIRNHNEYLALTISSIIQIQTAGGKLGITPAEFVKMQ